MIGKTEEIFFAEGNNDTHDPPPSWAVVDELVEVRCGESTIQCSGDGTVDQPLPSTVYPAW